MHTFLWIIGAVVVALVIGAILAIRFLSDPNSYR